MKRWKMMNLHEAFRLPAGARICVICRDEDERRPVMAGLMGYGIQRDRFGLLD